MNGPTPESERGKPGRPPKAVGTSRGETWPSVKVAAELFKVSLSTIPVAIHRGSLTCGRRWHYVEREA